MQILYTFLILGGLGLLLGIGLSVSSIFFYVKSDTRVEDITKMLPGYNCGACGCAGCRAFAEAIINGEVNKLSKCKPGKADTCFNPIKEYLDHNPNDDGTKINIQI